MLSALRPKARIVPQSVERRRGFGRRGEAKHLLLLMENRQKADRDFFSSLIERSLFTQMPFKAVESRVVCRLRARSPP